MSIDWSTIYKKYKGRWVALQDDYVTVITSGATPREVMKKAEKKGFPNPFLTKVPNKLLPFAG